MIILIYVVNQLGSQLIPCVSCAVNQLGKLRNDHDGQLTLGGDNNVILIQALNYLLSWFCVKKEG